jgi:hypothetical protein
MISMSIGPDPSQKQNQTEQTNSTSMPSEKNEPNAENTFIKVWEEVHQEKTTK